MEYKVQNQLLKSKVMAVGQRSLLYKEDDQIQGVFCYLDFFLSLFLFHSLIYLSIVSLNELWFVLFSSKIFHLYKIGRWSIFLISRIWTEKN